VPLRGNGLPDADLANVPRAEAIESHSVPGHGIEGHGRAAHAQGHRDLDRAANVDAVVVEPVLGP